MAQSPDFDLSIPVVIPGSGDAAELRTVQDAINWIDATDAWRREERLSEIQWTLRQARAFRLRGQADDASDRLVRTLADMMILKR